MKSLVVAVLGVMIGAGGMWAYSSFAAAGATEQRAAQPQGARETPAYLIVLGDVYDREAFIAGYSAKLAPLYEKYGGEYVALGRNKVVLENGREFQSFVISKWPSMEAAQDFWSDPDYEKLKDARLESGWSAFDVYLLEGLPE